MISIQIALLIIDKEFINMRHREIHREISRVRKISMILLANRI